MILVVGVRSPGRETRTSEAFIDDINEYVRQVGEEFYRLYGDKPFAFFGHR